MKISFIGCFKSIVVSFLLCLFLTFSFTGCLRRPLILRNRPNVPPPLVEPSDSESFIAIDDAIIEPEPPPVIEIPKSLPPPDIKTAPVTYTVEKGDSFWKVARMYGVSKEELAACNNLSLDKTLPVGVTLLIPPGGEFILPENRVNVKPISHKTPGVQHNKIDYTPSAADRTYVVKPGDSLWKIATRYKITTNLLAKANNIDKRKPIQEGQKLIIPGVGGSDLNSTVHKNPAEVIDNNKSSDNTHKKDAQKDDSNSNSNPEELINEEFGTETDTDTDIEEVKESEPAGSLYVEEVLPNETLQDIATRHGFTPEELRAVNPGLPADGKLKPFTSIKIPNK